MAAIVLTTTTSGTAALQRIIRRIAPAGHRFVPVSTPVTETAEEPGLLLDPAEPVIYWFQGTRFWDPTIDLSPFTVILHLRDPRDLICNLYWWALQHPVPGAMPEAVAAERAAVEALGIDGFARDRDLSPVFRRLNEVSEGPFGEAVTYTSYAQLCCAFDLLVERLCRAFGRPVRDVLPKLALERPENLRRNPNWLKVGGTWQGTDVAPGRFRRELTAETAALLTERYAFALRLMRLRDADFLAVHYGP